MLLLPVIHWFSAVITDIHQRYQTLHHFDPYMGLNFGGLRGSSCAYVTCMYCSLSMKTNTRKTQAAHEDHERIRFAFASTCVIGKKPEDPQIKPHA